MHLQIKYIIKALNNSNVKQLKFNYIVPLKGLKVRFTLKLYKHYIDYIRLYWLTSFRYQNHTTNYVYNFGCF